MLCKFPNFEKIFIFFILIFFSTASFASDGLPKQGEVIRDSFKVYEDGKSNRGVIRSIPLPKGEWIVVNTSERKSQNIAIVGERITPINLVDLVLAQVDINNQLIAAIYLTTNNTTQSYKWYIDYCKDSNDSFIYRNTYDGGFWQQRCTSIRPSTYLQSSTPGQNAVRNFYNSKGIKFNANAIMVQLSEIGTNGDLLRLDFFYFPNTYQLENPIVGNLTLSPWFKTNYKQDPVKVKFIEGLQIWSDSYSNLLNKFFNGSDKPIDKFDLYQFSVN